MMVSNPNKKLLLFQQHNAIASDAKLKRTKSLNQNDLNEKFSINDIELIKFKISEEYKIKEALEESYNELLTTSQELEKRIHLIDEESNEWKTRFENQEEINRLFTKQLELTDLKINELKEKLKSMKTRGQTREDKFENNIPQLEKEKETLLNQLRDYEWRIEQETKAYYKANEERKELNQEINDTRNSISTIKDRQDLANYQTYTSSAAYNTASNNFLKNNDFVQDSSSRISMTDYYYSNIPMNKRVIDPRKGPINKNAAIRLLPKLDC